MNRIISCLSKSRELLWEKQNYSYSSRNSSGHLRALHHAAPQIIHPEAVFSTGWSWLLGQEHILRQESFRFLPFVTGEVSYARRSLHINHFPEDKPPTGSERPVS